MRVLVAFVVILLLTAGAAAAQEKPVEAMRSALEQTQISLALNLLRHNGSVQKEVALSDEQRQKIEAAVPTGAVLGGGDFSGSGKGRRGDSAGGGKGRRGDPPMPPGRGGRDEPPAPRPGEHERADRSTYFTVLEAKQRQRLIEIAIQWRLVFQQPAVQEGLQLTEAQKVQISRAVEDASQLIRALGTMRVGAPWTWQDARGKELRDKIPALLNVEQKKLLDDLTGAPFDLRGVYSDTRGQPPPRPPEFSPGGPARRQYGDLDFFSQWATFAELGFTNEQILKLADEHTKFQIQIPTMVNLQGMTQQQSMLLMRDAGNRVVKDVLTLDQQKRFRQIVYQVDGVFTFAEPEVQEALRLTDDQKAKVAALVAELQPPQLNRGPRGGAPVGPLGDMRGGPDFEARRRLQQESATKVVALLTAEQKTVWENLIGAPFPPKP